MFNVQPIQNRQQFGSLQWCRHRRIHGARMQRSNYRH